MQRPAEAESPVEKARIAADVPMLRLEHLTGIARSTLKRKIDNPLTLTLGDLHSVATALNVDGGALYAEITAGGEA